MSAPSPISTSDLLADRCAKLSALLFKPPMRELLSVRELDMPAVVEQVASALGQPGKFALVLLEKSKVPVIPPKTAPAPAAAPAASMEVDAEGEVEEVEAPKKPKAKKPTKATPPPSPSKAKPAASSKQTKQKADTAMEDIAEEKEEEAQKGDYLEQIFKGIPQDERQALKDRARDRVIMLASGTKNDKKCADLHAKFKEWVAVYNHNNPDPKWPDRYLFSGAYLMHYIADCCNHEAATELLKWMRKHTKASLTVQTTERKFGLDEERATPMEVAGGRDNDGAVKFIHEEIIGAATAAVSKSSKKSIEKEAQEQFEAEVEKESKKEKSKMKAAAAPKIKEPTREELITLTEAERAARDALEDITDEKRSVIRRYQNKTTGVLNSIVMPVTLNEEQQEEWDTYGSHDRKKLVGSKFKQWEHSNPDWKPVGDGEFAPFGGQVDGVLVIEPAQRVSDSARAKVKGTFVEPVKKATKEQPAAAAAAAAAAVPRVTQTAPRCDGCGDTGKKGEVFPKLGDEDLCPKCMKTHQCDLCPNLQITLQPCLTADNKPLNLCGDCHYKAKAETVLKCIDCTADLDADRARLNMSRCAKCTAKHKCHNQQCDQKSADKLHLHKIKDEDGNFVKQLCSPCYKKHKKAQEEKDEDKPTACIGCKKPLTAANRVPGLEAARCVECNKGYASSPLVGKCSGKCDKKNLRESEVHTIGDKKYCTPCFNKQTCSVCNPEHRGKDGEKEYCRPCYNKEFDKQAAKEKVKCEALGCSKKFPRFEMHKRFDKRGNEKLICSSCTNITSEYFETPKTRCFMQDKEECISSHEETRFGMYHGLVEDNKGLHDVFYCYGCQKKRKAGGPHLDTVSERNCTLCERFMDDEEVDEDTNEPTTLCEDCANLECYNDDCQADLSDKTTEKFPVPGQPKGTFYCRECHDKKKPIQPCSTCKKEFNAIAMFKLPKNAGYQCRDCKIDTAFKAREKQRKGKAKCGKCLTKELTRKDVDPNGNLEVICIKCRLQALKLVCVYCQKATKEEDYTAQENKLQTDVCLKCRKEKTASCDKCENEFHKEDAKKNTKGQTLCTHCQDDSDDEELEEEEVTELCTNCSNEYPVSELEEDGTCKECNEMYGGVKCGGGCEEYYEKDDMVDPEIHNITDPETGEGVWACAKCVEEDDARREKAGEVECEVCEKHFPKDKANSYRKKGKMVWRCKECDEDSEEFKQKEAAADLAHKTRLEQLEAEKKKQNKEERDSDSDSEGGPVINRAGRRKEINDHRKTTLQALKDKPESPPATEEDLKDKEQRPAHHVTFSPSTTKGLSDSTDATQVLEEHICIPETPEKKSLAAKMDEDEIEEELKEKELAPTQAASSAPEPMQLEAAEEKFDNVISTEWQEELGPEGQIYYWNTKTNEAVEDKPLGPNVTIRARRAPPPPAPSSGGGKKKRKQDDEEEKAAEENKKARVATDPSPTASTPPLTQPDLKSPEQPQASQEMSPEEAKKWLATMGDEE